MQPELATNWGIGFDYTPSANFLTGLNLQATYYQIKLNGQLRNFGQPNSSAFNDPDLGENAVFVPTDWVNSGLPGAAACTSNLLPTTCAPFQDAVKGLLLHPRAQVSPQAQTLIMWIHDGGTVNRGWQKLDGIDFQASYDWEWGGYRRLQHRHHRHLLSAQPKPILACFRGHRLSASDGRYARN